jgi:hypothetical protein
MISPIGKTIRSWSLMWSKPELYGVRKVAEDRKSVLYEDLVDASNTEKDENS